jgi:RNA-binding protein
LPELRGFQKRYLRSLGHSLRPAVLVGAKGVTPSLHSKVDRELSAHELIKVKFNDFKHHRRDLARAIAEQARGEVVGLVGNVALIYRRQPDAERRRIELPERRASER